MTKESVTIFAVILLVIAVFCWVPTNDRSKINAWMSRHDVKATEISRCYFRMGPFWNTKNYRIYQVTTDRGEYWVRLGGIWPDIYRNGTSGWEKNDWSK